MVMIMMTIIVVANVDDSDAFLRKGLSVLIEGA